MSKYLTRLHTQCVNKFCNSDTLTWYTPSHHRDDP
jgi:hypothetical protein